jgi:hypothetical protein
MKQAYDCFTKAGGLFFGVLLVGEDIDIEGPFHPGGRISIEEVCSMGYSYISPKKVARPLRNFTPRKAQTILFQKPILG